MNTDGRWVKRYKSLSPEFMSLSWQTRSVFHDLCTICNADGFIKTGKRAAEGLANTLACPIDVITPAIVELIDDGCVDLVEGGLVIINFQKAQENPNTTRSRRHRETKSQSVACNANATVTTLQSVADPLHATPMQRHATLCNDREEESREEKSRTEESRTEERGAGENRGLRGTSGGSSPSADAPSSTGVPTHGNGIADSSNALPPSCDDTMVSAPDGLPESKNVTLPAKRTRKAREPKPDLDPSELNAIESKALASLQRDASLSEIVTRPIQLARDLTAIAPGCDVAHEVTAAGAWLRANPANRKSNGNAFLTRWLTRAQERARAPVSQSGVYRRSDLKYAVQGNGQMTSEDLKRHQEVSARISDAVERQRIAAGGKESPV